MKVSELVEKLSGIDQTLDVVFSIDPEGNAFRHVVDVEISPYRADGSYVEVISDEDYENGEYGDVELSYAVVFWP